MRIAWLILVVVVALSGQVSGQGTIRFVPVPGYQIPGPELGAVPDELGAFVFTELDLNGDGTDDFVFRTSNTQQVVSPAAGNFVLARANPPPDQSRYAMPLGRGAEIGPSLMPSLSWEGTLPPSSPSLPPRGITIVSCFGSDGGAVCLGDFLLQDAYLGIQFQIDGQPHYGWMHLKNQVGSSFLHGYAYNTLPNEPILAGQVPEPSTWVLLAGGLVVGMFLRRRRA